MFPRRILPTVVLISAVSLALSTPGFADEPALLLHLTDASYSGCATIDPTAMTCEDIEVEGSAVNTQFAFVLASDVPSIAGVQFGTYYGSGVDVTGWTLCADAMEIREDGWPGSGRAVAVAWHEVQYPSSQDSLVMIGYFTVSSASSGLVSVTPDMRIGEALFTDAEMNESVFHPLALGRGDVDGGGLGYNPCGAELPWSGSDLYGWGEGDGGAGGGQGPVGGFPPTDIDPIWTTTESQLGPLHVYSVKTRPATGYASVFGKILTAHRTAEYNVHNGNEIGRQLTGAYPDIVSYLNEEDLVTVMEGSVFHCGAAHLGPSQEHSDVIIARVTPLPGVLWQESYDSYVDGGGAPDPSPNDYAAAIVLDEAARAVYVAGRTTYEWGNWPILIKYDAVSGGDPEWSVFYEDFSGNRPSSLVQGPVNGHLYMLCRREGVDLGHRVLAFDPENPPTVPIWNRPLNSAYDELDRAVFGIDNDNNIVVAVEALDDGRGSTKIVMWKLNGSNGADLWGGPLVGYESEGIASSEVHDMSIDSSNNIYLAGRFSNMAGLARFPANPQGEQLYDWIYTLPFLTSRGALACDLDDADRYIYATGDLYDQGIRELFALCVSVHGTGVWMDRLDLSGTDYDESRGYTIDAKTVPPWDLVYVGGDVYKDEDPQNPDMVIVRYPSAPAVDGVQIAKTTASASPWRISGGSGVSIRFTEKIVDELELRVFDVSGRLRSSLLVPSGTQKLSIDGLSSGVYFVRGLLGSQTFVGRAAIFR